MKFSIAMICCLLVASSASDAAIILDPGITLETDGISRFVTGGANMTGMEVTVTFTDGSTEMSLFSAVSGVIGEAFGTAWSLTFDGPDTYNSGDPLNDLSHVWKLSNTSSLGISSILLNGQPARTVFDIESPQFTGLGTDGSEHGETFKEAASNGFGRFTVYPNSQFTGLAVDVTYSNSVGLTGVAPVGDLFARMKIDFLDFGGLQTGRSYYFLADTDNATSLLIPPTQVGSIPEPSSIALTAIGLLGQGCMWRRRKSVA